MAKKKDPAASKYEKQFRQRLKMARESADLSQSEMARALGLDVGTYAKYETRSMLPMRFLAPVCELSSFDPWFMLTGKPGRVSGSQPPTTQAAPSTHSQRAAP